MSNASNTSTPDAAASAHSPAFVMDMASPFKLFAPLVIVMGTGALAYTQAPKLTGYFAAPPPVVAYQPPAPPIEKAPVASIPTPAPAPQPVAHEPEVMTPKPILHAKPKKHVVHHAPVRELEDDLPPVRRVYPVYPVYRRPAYVPVPFPLPLFGGHGGGHMFGGFGGFGRR